MTRVFLSAGEISGDRYGAALVAAITDDFLKKGVVAPSFVGMGGDAMRSVGVDIRWDVTDMSTIGFIEPLKYLFRFWRTYRAIKAYLQMVKPDLIIPIDFQGFNLAVCRAAKSLGIPVIYYIGPQFWQWGKASDAIAYLALNQRLLTIFEEEQSYYQQLGADPIYIGHPLLDLLPGLSRHEGLPEMPLEIAIFPGSRPQEMRHVAPVLLAAAKQLQASFAKREIRVCVTVSVSHPRYAEKLKQLADHAGIRNCCFVSGVPLSLLETCHFAFATSGTMTLELALAGIPMVSVYRFHPLSYQLAKWVVGKKIKAMGHFSLPNLMLKERVVPEFLQDDATASSLFAAAENLLTNSAAHATIQVGYAKLRERLGSGGATARAANEVSRYLFQIKDK